MKQIRNLTVQYSEGSDTLRAAGVCKSWQRPVILSDDAAAQHVFRGKAAVLLCPEGWTESERRRAEAAASRAGLGIVGTRSLAAAAASYYAAQDMPDSGSERMMVIDAEARFTDLSVVRICGNVPRTVMSERVEDADGDGAGELLRAARRIRFRGLFGEGPVLLTGERELPDRTQRALAEALGRERLITYRREDVPLLGAAGMLPGEPGGDGAAVSRLPGSDVTWTDEFPQRDAWIHPELTAGQRRMVKKLWEGALRGEREVICDPEKDWDPQDVSRIWHELYYQEHPEMDLFQRMRKLEVWISRCEGGKQMRVKYHFRKKRRELTERVRNRAEEILQACAGAGMCSDRALLERLYRYIARNYRYAELLPKGEYPPEAYTIEALLKDGVCQGYALSMLYLLHRLQIPALFVSGDAEAGDLGGHAWNLVQLADGTWRHMDVTWDLENGREAEAFFLLDDIQMKARRHFWDARGLPRCG